MPAQVHPVPAHSPAHKVTPLEHAGNLLQLPQLLQLLSRGCLLLFRLRGGSLIAIKALLPVPLQRISSRKVLATVEVGTVEGHGGVLGAQLARPLRAVVARLCVLLPFKEVVAEVVVIGPGLVAVQLQAGQHLLQLPSRRALSQHRLALGHVLLQLLCAGKEPATAADAAEEVLSVRCQCHPLHNGLLRCPRAKVPG